MESSKVRTSFRVAALVLAVVVGLTTASLSAKDYSIQSWKTGRGLEARGIACCLVGRDGMVWIGAIGDLMRFDGVRFERVPFVLSRSFSGDRITALYEDRSGRIWCGYETGEVVVYDPQDGHARMMPMKWVREPVRAIDVDPQGDEWLILDDQSIVRVRDGRTTGSYNLGGGLRFMRTDTGKFLAERSGSIYEWQPDNTWKHIHQGFNYIAAAFPSRKGGIWVYSPNFGKVFRIRDDDTILETRMVSQSLYASTMIEAKSGKVIGAVGGGGIVSIGEDSSVVSYGTSDGLASLWVQAMAEDPNGDIVAVSSEGVSVLRMTEAEVVNGLADLGGARLTGVSVGTNGSVWIGTEGKGLYRNRGGTIEHFGLEAGLSNLNIWSVLDDGTNGVWAGSWGGGLEIGKEGHFRLETGWALPQHWVVTALLDAADGSIWAGTNDGIGRKKEGAWSWYTQSGSIPLVDARFLAEGQGGRIWFGSNGYGVGYIEGTTVKLLGPEAGTGSRFMSALRDDGRGGVWIGTEGEGLFNWRRGHWTQITTEDGLPSDTLFHIDDDGRGRLWFTSSVGVYAVAKEALEAIVAGNRQMVHPLMINSEDGLPSNQCVGGTLNAAYLSEGGQYYVPTSAGLAVIDTRKIQPADGVLHPSILRVMIDGRQNSFWEGHVLVAPPRTQSMRVEFTAPTLTHPALVEFAYRLDGDGRSGWIFLGQNRTLSLQRLPPGLHRLEIRAWDPGSKKMGPRAMLEIEQKPTLVETLWFRELLGGICLVILVIAIWSVVRQRYARRQRRLELEAAVEKERRRIARDIHDDLGAHLAQMMLLSQDERRLDETPDRKHLFEKIHSKAKEITKSLDELVWAVNPSHDTVEGFATYAARIAQEMISSAGLRCRLRIPESIDSVSLRSGARHDLVMCLKEAITNAIQHASCTQIEVRLEMGDDLLRLTVSDDGRGMDVAGFGEAGREDVSHSGCHNMRARMGELRGRVEVVSSLGKGTRVTFEYPL